MTFQKEIPITLAKGPVYTIFPGENEPEEEEIVFIDDNDDSDDDEDSGDDENMDEDENMEEDENMDENDLGEGTSDEDEEEEEETFSVEEILKHRVIRGQVQYYIKWVGFDEKTWGIASDFIDKTPLEAYVTSKGSDSIIEFEKHQVFLASKK